MSPLFVDIVAKIPSVTTAVLAIGATAFFTVAFTAVAGFLAVTVFLIVCE